MTISHSLPLTVPTVATDQLSPFRFGAFRDGVLLTNDQGKWHWLVQADFLQFITGELDQDSTDFKMLSDKGFVRSALQLESYSTTIRQRKEFLSNGPKLHQIWLDDQHGTLTIESAKAIVDHLMQSTSQDLELEFIQQTAAIDHEVFAFVISYVQEKNRYESKNLCWTLCSAFSDIPAQLFDILIEQGFTIKLQLDSANLLDAASSEHYAAMKANLQQLGSAATVKQKDLPSVSAHLQIGQEQAKKSNEMLAELTEIGVGLVYIEPKLYGSGALSEDDFPPLFREVLQQLLTDKYNIIEGHTQSLVDILLHEAKQPKIGYRSPTGAGLGVHGYDTTGKIFPNKQASQMGDAMFLLGQAGDTTYEDVLQHATVKTLALASLVDCLPGFCEHWSAPFLSVDPIDSYLHTGDLFEKLPTSPRVQTGLARLEVIFDMLLQSDDAYRKKLEAWL